MKFALHYGDSFLEANIPEKNISAILKPRGLSPVENEEEAIKKAVREPIGGIPLKNMVSVGTRVGLLVSDVTRPCPSYKILPALIADLRQYGVLNDNITIFFANGMHRLLNPAEKTRLVGEKVAAEIRMLDHDSRDSGSHCHLGKTSRNTEIFLDKQVQKNDLIIGVANIDIHYFAGYSGGGKSLLPGVCSFETIAHNHSLMLLPNASPGVADGNPVREDLEEACCICNLGFIVNAVLDESKQIVKVVAGDFVKAHRAGAALYDYMYKAAIDEEADIVVATAGGFPKDINLYQAQKALDNARFAVKKGGTIILLAECCEGLGDKTFEQWFMEAATPEGIIERMNKGFVLGGHKAYAVAKTAADVNIILVSDLPGKIVKKTFMMPARTLKQALDRAFKGQGKDARVIVMPFAGSTFPVKK
jgi:nickel-dependent lactate racemase